jgi:tetratricopeptide (TPR) repeat protein
MFLLIALLAQSAALPTFDEVRMRDCLTLTQTDAPSAIINANEWMKNKGGYLAQACLAAAYSEQSQHAKAAEQFAAAAAKAGLAKDKITPALWAQAGDAALLAGDAAMAQGYLNTALTSGTLQSFLRGAALLNRARAFVAMGQLDPAAGDLTEARRIMPGDPAAWLLSATLARRAGTLNEAQQFIKTAAALSPSDASVALEAGNIAASAGAYDIARAQWLQTIRITPQSPAADTARRLLEQLAIMPMQPGAPVRAAQADDPKEPETR